MKLIKNSDITLIVDGDGVPIFFEPVRSQQTVLCIEGHERSDLRTFEVPSHRFLLGYFLRMSAESSPEEIGSRYSDLRSLKLARMTLLLIVMLSPNFIF